MDLQLGSASGGMGIKPAWEDPKGASTENGSEICGTGHAGVTGSTGNMGKREGAAQNERHQLLAQSHIVAMSSQKIEIFNLANCFIYFVEVPLDITAFFQLVLEQSYKVFVHQPSAQHRELFSFKSRSEYIY